MVAATIFKNKKSPYGGGISTPPRHFVIDNRDPSVADQGIKLRRILPCLATWIRHRPAWYSTRTKFRNGQLA